MKNRSEFEVSSIRLAILRAMYLLIAVGLGFTVWPGIVSPQNAQADAYSVIDAVLGAFALMAALGLRYPLKMLPILLFELAWKCIWTAFFAIRMWRDGGLDAYAHEVLVACIMGIVLTPLAIPWKYVLHTYVKAKRDPWRSGVKRI